MKKLVYIGWSDESAIRVRMCLNYSSSTSVQQVKRSLMNQWWMKIFMAEMSHQYTGLSRVLATAGPIDDSPSGHWDTPFTLNGNDGKHPLQIAWEIFLGRKDETVIMWRQSIHAQIHTQLLNTSHWHVMCPVGYCRIFALVIVQDLIHGFCHSLIIFDK